MNALSTPRRRTTIVVFAVLLLTLLFATVAGASPVSKKKARLKVVKAKLNRIYTASEVATEKYNQANSQYQTVLAKITENEDLLAQAEKNLATANEQLTRRARSIYKARDVDFVDVMFEAHSFDELVTQMDMMQRLSNSDVDTVKSITAYRRDIKDRRIKLEADRQAAATLLQQRTQRKDAILGIEHRLQKLTRHLKTDIKRLKREAALAARLRYGGIVPTPVDPNSPGHPEIVSIARQYFGVPYVWGGASPSGFDCSGLTMYCYAKIGIGMSHGATDQQRQSIPIAFGDMRPGDLIFFGSSSFSHHVAIFVSGTTCIEAPHTGDHVRYGTYTGRDAWIGGRF